MYIVNNNNEVKGLLENQGIYRGNGFIVISTFYFNYQVNDFILIETSESQEKLQAIIVTPELKEDIDNFNLKPLGLIFDYGIHDTTATSN